MTKQQIPPILRPENTFPVSLLDLATRFGLAHSAGPTDARITGISMNTADLRPGDLFVAMPGLKAHGAQFAQKAIKLGAAAVVTDAAGEQVLRQSEASIEVPVYILEQPRLRLGDLAAFVYGNTPENMPLLLGTTGTNGKTSTTYILDGILRQLGRTTGLTSTAERHIAGEVIVSRLTTPESTEMHALIARMRERGVDAISLEVSAQALTQHRIDGLVFDVVGFTNLSHDHLDDYRDMSEYLEAKAELFTPLRARRGVVCLDSPYGEQFAAKSGVPNVSISSRPEVSAGWHVHIDEETAQHTKFTVTAPDEQTLSSSVPIIGAHMAANAGLAIVMLVEAGFEFEQIAKAIANGIDCYLPGRTERVSGSNGPDVYVDFGHSPDAFLNTLSAVRKVTTGRLFMVFGADGDRDASKRPEMARIAAVGSDVLVITDHHPRFEDPASIRKTLFDAAVAARPELEIYEVSPPEQAIRKAVSLAKPGDSILWAGPGHQDYRDIEGVRTPYSARSEARAALKECGWK